jgi:hypothetical protein
MTDYKSDSELPLYQSVSIKNSMPIEKYEYHEKVCILVFQLQEYCRNNCIPIFNNHKMLNILLVYPSTRVI